MIPSPVIQQISIKKTVKTVKLDMEEVEEILAKHFSMPLRNTEFEWHGMGVRVEITCKTEEEVC